MFTLGIRDGTASSVQHLLRYASALKLSPITPSELPFLSAFIRQASDIHLFNIPATYYPCPFFSILFSQIFDSLSISWSGWKRIAPTPKLWSSVVSFLHTLCVHQPVGPGLKKCSRFSHIGPTVLRTPSFPKGVVINAKQRCLKRVARETQYSAQYWFC